MAPRAGADLVSILDEIQDRIDAARAGGPWGLCDRAYLIADLALLIEAFERLDAICRARGELLDAHRRNEVPTEEAMRRVDKIAGHLAWLRERGLIW